jgi:ketosteroid isomerase-like protein
MTTMIDETRADAFVRDWIDAWNTHDVDRITAHYADDVEYHSPVIARVQDGPPELRGAAALRAYVTAALERHPQLHFDPAVAVAVGADSVAIVYRSVADQLAVETLVVDEGWHVVRAYCHYAPPSAWPAARPRPSADGSAS